MKSLQDILLESTMRGFFTNVAGRLNAKDMLGMGARKFELNGKHSSVYVSDNMESLSKSPSFFEIRRYYTRDNTTYKNLDIRFDTDKIKSDFGSLIDFKSCDDYEVTQAWLHYINLLSANDRTEISSYLVKYSNIKKWRLKSNNSCKLSYGNAIETIYIVDNGTDAVWNALVFTVYK